MVAEMDIGIGICGGDGEMRARVGVGWDESRWARIGIERFSRLR